MRMQTAAKAGGFKCLTSGFTPFEAASCAILNICTLLHPRDVFMAF